MIDKTDVALRPETPIAEQHPGSVLDLMATAVLKGDVPIETMRALHEMHSEEVARQARAEFAKAKREAKSALPAVIHNREGDRGRYHYADFDHVVTVVRPVLHAHGLDDTYDTEPQADGRIAVYCILTHDNGHSERTRFDISAESRAGMSEQQKAGSAVSHAKRYALLLALGLSTTDQRDDDGASAGAPDPITDQQAADLRALVEEHGRSIGKLCAWAKVERVEDMPASKFRAAVALMEAKR